MRLASLKTDWKNLTAVPLRALDRQEINMSSMADMIQSLISEYNLVGFVVGTKHAKPMEDLTSSGLGATDLLLRLSSKVLMFLIANQLELIQAITENNSSFQRPTTHLKPTTTYEAEDTTDKVVHELILI
ncbi:hypothetical protein Q3G72_020739 [Acer saccharum]|nr:hypothetical protein Q3G72_020739 [Acer saccharum]